MLEDLRIEIHHANLVLYERGLVDLFRGTVTAFDRQRGLLVVRPRGLDFRGLSPADYLVVSGQDGRVVEGFGDPAIGFEAHMALFEEFPGVEAAVSSHSKYATIWAQAEQAIPCLGLSHAEYFKGDVPVVRVGDDFESASAYYKGSGRAIVDHFRSQKLNPSEMPAALLARDGPVAWGSRALEAARMAVYLESLSETALHTLHLNPSVRRVNGNMVDVLHSHGLSIHDSRDKLVRGALHRKKTILSRR